MKNLKFLQMMILLVSLCSCDSCKDDVWTELPPETQIGANTFGCYVNGELFVRGEDAPFAPKRLSAEYNKEKNHLILSSYSATYGHYIYLESGAPKVNVPIPISLVYFLPRQKKIHNCCFQFSGKETGEIFFTKLDTVNRIVSGRFQFQGQCSNAMFEIAGDSIVSITQGRFDIKLDIYDN